MSALEEALESGSVDRILKAIDALSVVDEETLLSLLIALQRPGLDLRHQRDLSAAMCGLLARQDVSFWQSEAAWMALDQVDVGSQYECNMMGMLLRTDPLNARALDAYMRASLADEGYLDFDLERAADAAANSSQRAWLLAHCAFLYETLGGENLRAASVPMWTRVRELDASLDVDAVRARCEALRDHAL